MSNFLYIFSCFVFSMNNRLRAIGAYDVVGVFVPLACSVRSKNIDSLCWSLLAWSITLLSFWLAVPTIHATEKFLVPRILFSNFLHVWHHKLVTWFCCLSQRSHESVLCSFSCCFCLFWKVATDTVLLSFLGWLSQPLAETSIDRLEAIAIEKWNYNIQV